MGDFNHENIQWNTYTIRDINKRAQELNIENGCALYRTISSLNMYYNQPGSRVIDLVLSSPKEFVDNVNIQEPFL